MSLARRLLLRGSRSARLAQALRRLPFFRRAVRRFLPGEDLDAALAAAADLAPRGLGSVLTQLGEQVASVADAARVRDHYLDALERVRSRGLDAQLSVKLTHLGLEQDRTACVRAVATLADRASGMGSFLWVDMEESRYVDATLDLVREVRASRVPVGVCLQAYLQRTPADLEGLLAAGVSVRLVKGAYNEPAAIAFPRKRDVDAAYLRLAGRLLEHALGARPVFGTHDPTMIARIRDDAARLGVRPDAYEIHMLYGIRAGDQQALARAGCRVRVLISYGSAWFPWYMRRLAERPANVWFVLRHLFA
ncbi:MAG TPA: proline dehydrogenase family protein [Gemmatimonadales bacterium]|nr:proline dehydrogenase family protein [Gemmatimonadales bacterium]